MIVARRCDDPDETDILAATGNSFLERHYSRTDIDLLNSYPDKERETEIKREIERERGGDRENNNMKKIGMKIIIWIQSIYFYVFNSCRCFP